MTAVFLFPLEPAFFFEDGRDEVPLAPHNVQTRDEVMSYTSFFACLPISQLGVE